MESLVSIVIALVLVGVVLWVIETIIPMDPSIKLIIRVVILIAVCLWLLAAVGLWSGGRGPVIR